MLPRDCEELLKFVRERDPVVITVRDAASPEVSIVEGNACSCDDTLILWNQCLIPHLKRELVRPSKPYYTIKAELPLLEMLTCRECEWGGKPALMQGRIWGSFSTENKALEKWYRAITHWIRRTYRPNPVGFLKGYISPRVLEWHNKGGVLLPMFIPPDTAEWRSFAKAQSPMQSE
jgi:hypothetical protein